MYSVMFTGQLIVPDDFGGTSLNYILLYHMFRVWTWSGFEAFSVCLFSNNNKSYTEKEFSEELPMQRRARRTVKVYNNIICAHIIQCTKKYSISAENRTRSDHMRQLVSANYYMNVLLAEMTGSAPGFCEISGIFRCISLL